MLDATRRRELGVESVVDPEALARFARSVGTPDLFDRWDRQQIVVQRGGTTALVGGGHFACAFRRAALDSVPPGRCTEWERDWLDLPPDAAGWWRLATPTAYALHLGNTAETWMHATLDALPPRRRSGSDRIDLPPLAIGTRSGLHRVPFPVRNRLASVVLRRLKRERVSPTPG